MELDSDFQETLRCCTESNLKLETTDENPESWEDIAWFHQFLRHFSKATDTQRYELVKQFACENSKHKNMGKASKAVLQRVKT